MAVKFYHDNLTTIYCGDCRRMVEMAEESVHCIATSPPYWGLREYEGSQELIWGDCDCEHEWGEGIKGAGKNNDQTAGEIQTGNIGSVGRDYRPDSHFCLKCGAWKGAYGLEPTPGMYVQHTIEILREIRRVLREDGVVFWNIGDSYAANRSYQVIDTKWRDVGNDIPSKVPDGLKPKDPCLIPFHIAIAAQEDGWWVRSVIIWNKPNPMPESVGDRPTNTYEFILMLTKSGTTQYWTHRDHEGTRKQPKPDYRWIKQVSITRGLKTKGDQEVSAPEQNHGLDIVPQNIVEEVAVKPEGWTRENKIGWDRINLWEGHDYYYDADAVRELYTEPLNRWGGDTLKRDTSKTAKYKDMLNIGPSSAFRVGNPIRPNETGRNLRDVWTFPTTPYPKAHFAVFPEKLPELCIKAATSEKGCCPKCGAPWARITETSREFRSGSGRAGNKPMGKWAEQEEASGGLEDDIRAGPCVSTKTLGWRPTCNCGQSEVIPCVVLDPFCGTGTTLWVAKKLGRRATGYDISEAYCQLSVERNRQMALEIK